MPIQRCFYGIASRVERGAERISHRLEDMTVVRLDHLTQQLVVRLEVGLHLLRVSLPQTSRALDVGEEERDGARRRRWHDRA